MKIVVSLQRQPDEVMPTARQVRLALGSATAEAIQSLERTPHGDWRTVIRETKEKK
jgi:hypothetical protein